MQDVDIETEAPNYFKKTKQVYVRLSEDEFKRRLKKYRVKSGYDNYCYGIDRNILRAVE